MWPGRTGNTKKYQWKRNNLKTAAKKEDYEEIRKTVTFSETATKNHLQQRKFENFTSLKYKSKSAAKPVNDNNEGIRTNEEQPRPTKPSYGQALKANKIIFEKENSTSHNENKRNKNINERLNHLFPIQPFSNPWRHQKP